MERLELRKTKIEFSMLRMLYNFRNAGARAADGIGVLKVREKAVIVAHNGLA